VITPLELYGSRGYLVKPFVCRGGPSNEVQEIIQAVRRRKEVNLTSFYLLPSLIDNRVLSLVGTTLLTWKEGHH
jgi:hypothetical protein